MKTTSPNSTEAEQPEDNSHLWRTEVIPELITLFKESTKRTRFIFSLLNLTALILLVCFFNSHFSWSRHPSIYDGVKKDLPEIDFKHLSKINDVIEWCSDTMSLSPVLKQENQVCLQKLLLVKSEIFDHTTGLPKFVYQNAQYSSTKRQLPVDYDFLNWEFLGIHIFNQDIPLIGGFGVLILVTWFYYARRREKGILRELLRHLSRPVTTALRYKVIYGVSLNPIFNSVKGIDEDHITFAKNISSWFVRLLLVLPCIMISLLQISDSIENHLKGPHFQQYLKLTNGDGYLYGENLRYYQINFGLPNYSVVHNVATDDYINVIDHVEGLDKAALQRELIIVELISSVFIFFTIAFTINTYIAIYNENVMKKKIIEDEYRRLRALEGDPLLD